jgi:hypothetical protein
MYFYPATEADFNQQKEVVNEVEQERYKVYTGSNENSYEVLILGIESAEQANKIKEEIKQYLSTNKF